MQIHLVISVVAQLFGSQIKFVRALPREAPWPIRTFVPTDIKSTEDACDFIYEEETARVLRAAEHNKAYNPPRAKSAESREAEWLNEALSQVKFICQDIRRVLPDQVASDGPFYLLCNRETEDVVFFSARMIRQTNRLAHRAACVPKSQVKKSSTVKAGTSHCDNIDAAQESEAELWAIMNEKVQERPSALLRSGYHGNYDGDVPAIGASFFLYELNGRLVQREDTCSQMIVKGLKRNTIYRTCITAAAGHGNILWNFAFTS